MKVATPRPIEWTVQLRITKTQQRFKNAPYVQVAYFKGVQFLCS